MREKGKRRKVRRILAMFLAVLIFATSADLTVLAAGADDKSAGTAATGEEGAVPIPNEVYGENVPEGTNEVYEETGSSAQGAEAEAEGQGTPDRAAGELNQEEGASGGKNEVISHDTDAKNGSSVKETDLADTVSGFKIQEDAVRSRYIIGRDTALDYSGLAVSITYEDGAEELIYDGKTVSERGVEIQYDESAIDWENLHPGTYEIVVRCGELWSENFQVQFISADIYSMEAGQELEFATDSSKDYSLIEFTPEQTGEYLLLLLPSNSDWIETVTAVDEYWRDVTLAVSTLTYKRYMSASMEAGKKYYFAVPPTKGSLITATLEYTGIIESAELITPPDVIEYISSQSGASPLSDFTGMQIKLKYADGTERILKDGEGLPDERGLAFKYDFHWSVPGEYSIQFYFNSNAVVEVPFILVDPQEYVKHLDKLEENIETAIRSDADKIQKDFQFNPQNSGRYSFKLKSDGYIDNALIDIKSADTGDTVSFSGNDTAICELEAGKTYIVMTKGKTNNNLLTISAEKLPVVSRLEIIKPPKIQRYLQGDRHYINYLGLRVRVTYEDGTTEELEYYEELKDGTKLKTKNNVNVNIPGTYAINVSVGEITASVPIYIYSEEDFGNAFPCIRLGEDQNLSIVENDNRYVIEAENSGDYIISFKGKEETFFGIRNVHITSLNGEQIYSDSMRYPYDLILTPSLEGGKKYLIEIEGKEGYQFTLNASKAKEVSHLEILTEPDKTEYIVGTSGEVEDISFSGLTEKVVYADGEEEIIPDNWVAADSRHVKIDHSDVDLTRPGEYQVKVSFGGKSTSFTIHVVSEEEYLKRFEYLSEGTDLKMQLLEGKKEFAFTPGSSGEYVFHLSEFEGKDSTSCEVFNVTGTNVSEYNYSDDENYSVTAFLEAGKNYICSFYSSVKRDIVFTAVQAKDVESLEILSLPYKTKYMQGDSPLRKAGLSVKAAYSDGSEETLLADQPAADYRCLRVDDSQVDFSSISNEQKVEVLFGNKTVCFTIDVESAYWYMYGLDTLELETVETLYLPAGGAEYKVTPKNGGLYKVAIESDSDEFNADGKFIIKDRWNNRQDQKVDFVDGKYISSAIMSNGESVIFSFSNNKEAYVTLTSIKCKDVSGLEVIRKPYKTTYLQSDRDNPNNIQYEGLLIRIIYNDGTEEIIGPDEISEEGFRLTYENNIDFTKPGNDNYIGIVFGGMNVNIPISVLPREDYINGLQTLSILEPQVLDLKAGNQEYIMNPAESGTYIFTLLDTEYEDYKGSFDITDLNGNSQIIGQRWNGVRLLTEVNLQKGEQYICQFNNPEDCKIQFSAVRMKKIKNLEISNLPAKVNYLVSDSEYGSVDTNGLNLKVIYEDDSYEILQPYADTADGRQVSITYDQIDWRVAGTYPIRVSCGSVSQSFDIHILSSEDYLGSLDRLELEQEIPLQADKLEIRKEFKFTPSSDGTYILYTESVGSQEDYTAAEIYDADGKSLNQQNITSLNGGISLSAELKANETYIYRLNFSSDIKIRILRAKEVTGMKLLAVSAVTEYQVGRPVSDTVLGRGIEAEITYKDGSKERLKWGGNDQEGRTLNIDSSLLNWEQPGVYTVKTVFGNVSADFSVEVLSAEAYYADTESWDMIDKNTGQEAGKIKKLSFRPASSGYYRLIVSTFGEAPAAAMIFDDTYEEMSYTISDSSDLEVGSFEAEYTVKLTAGKQYYLQIINNSDVTDITYQLKLEKIPAVKTITVNPGGANLTCIAGDQAHIFSLDKLEVEAVFADGKREKLAYGTYEVQLEYNSIEPGTYPQTVEAFGREANFNLTVVRPQDYDKIKEIKLNELETIKQDVGESEGNYIYKFIPSASGRFYLNTQSANYGQLAVLTGSGNAVENMSLGSCIAINLIGGITYYLVPRMLEDTVLNECQFMISNADLKITNQGTMSYTGEEYRPAIKVELDGKELTADEYTVSYENNINAGIGYALVKVKGQNVIPAVKSYFKILQRNISAENVSGIPAQGYTGQEICPKPVVMVNGDVLKEGIDYTLRYINNVDAGTAQVSVVGRNNYCGIIKKTFEIQAGGFINYVLDGGTNNKGNLYAYGEAGLILKAPFKKGYTFVGWYTDSKLTKKITEIPGSQKKDYTVYAGWKKISLGKTSISSLTNSGTSALKVQYGTVQGAEGYEVNYAVNSVFTDGKTITVSQPNVTITGLKAGTTYYVRVRAFKTDSAGEKVYSEGGYSTYKMYKTAPAAPQINTVTGGTNKITVSWDKVTGASYYEVYMATSKTGTYSKIASVKSGTTSYAKSGLSTAKTYYFKVRAYTTLDGSKIYGSFGTIKYGTTATAAPAISSAAGGSGKATIKWGAVTGASGYAVYMAASANGTYSKLTTVSSSTLSYTKTGLSAAKTYYFKVRAYRKGEGVNVYSSYSAAKNAGTAPAVPQISALTGGTGKITLSWKDISGESKYQVYRATSEKGTYSRIATLNANTTSYTNSGLSAAKTYYYKVRAYRTVNGANVYSSFGTVKYGTTAPSIPAITSAAGGTGKITVKWKAVSGASGYALYMATSASGTYSKVAALGSSTLSYSKTGLSAAKNYYFKVRAYRTSGGANVYSGYSSAFSGGTATATPQISAVTGGTGKVTLTWKDVSGESKYQVYRATSEKGTYSRIATLNANTKSYTNTGLSAAKTYYYKVRSYRVVNGANVYSSFGSVKYAATAPSVPSITSVAGGTGKITVKWKAVTGASGYALYMSTSASGTYSKVAALNSSTLNYTKTGLSAAKNYYFKIRAYRTAGGANVYSGYSSAVSGGTATSTPAISKAAAGKKKVTLSWKDVSGETKYQVYMSDSKNGTYSLAATLNANTKSYTKTGLTAGKTHYFKIRTYRTVNGKAVYSGFSSVKSAIPT